MIRQYEKLLNEYLLFFPCVALIGPRQCGKTTLLQTLPKDWKVFDLEKQSDFQNLSQEPDLFFRLNPDKIAIDEAQLRPELFPALRVAVDRNRQRTGRFIITGSSSPKLVRSISESLAINRRNWAKSQWRSLKQRLRCRRRTVAGADRH